MKLSTVRDTLVLGAARAHSRLTMSAPVERDEHTAFAMTVAGTQDLGGGMRRITFAAPELETYTLAGPDEYLGLLMPRPGRRLHRPEGARSDVRAALAAMPEDERPDLRWYTVRAHRPEVAEIDVDIVTHGDSGPGSAWALRAKVGDPVGLTSGGALYRGAQVEGPQLLVADETAVPALAAVLDDRSRRGLDDSDLRLHVEVADRALLGGYDLPESTRVHERGSDAPGAAVHRALAADPASTTDLRYAWLCGEAGMVTSLRRHLVREVGMDRRSILFCGYWKVGAARG